MTDTTHTTDAAAYAGIVTEYSATEAALSELRSRYAGVIFPVETKEGMKDAKETRQKLTKLRTGLEALRKEIKEPALRRTQAIDAEAKSIEKAIRAIEEPIDAQIKAEEQRVAAEKAAKEAAERARIDEIRGKIDAIRRLPLELANEPIDVIAVELDALSTFIPDAATFAEFAAEAGQVHAQAIIDTAQLLEKVRAKEAAATELKAEQEKLAAERAAIEAEKAALAAERAALAAAKAEVAATAVEPAAPAVEPEPAQQLSLADEYDAVIEAIEEIEAAPVADWTVRRLALSTADQFGALATKVAACGAEDFANQLRAAAYSLREGDHDSKIAAADRAELLAADYEVMNASSACIDVLREKAAA